MSGSLDRNRIMKLFGELSEELEQRGLRGHVYLVVGAASSPATGESGRRTMSTPGSSTRRKA